MVTAGEETDGGNYEYEIENGHEGVQVNIIGIGISESDKKIAALFNYSTKVDGVYDKDPKKYDDAVKYDEITYIDVLNKKLKWPILNPLLVAVAIVIAIIKVLDLDYENYRTYSKYLSDLLTPATVCLAIPLYQKLELLKK